MSKRTQICTSKWAAILCLTAVVLLQAPFAQAAWIARQMACCASGQCSIPSHHHHKAEPAKEDTPMQCGHDRNKMSECKMSCCKTTDETAIGVAPFVLPYSAIVFERQDRISGIRQFAPQMISRFYRPQSPPPRPSLS